MYSNDKLSLTNFHRLSSGKILDGKHIFCSPIFVIRYCSEEVLFNLITQFHTEIDMENFKDETQFYIETELLFADFGEFDTAEKAVDHYRELVII